MTDAGELGTVVADERVYKIRAIRLARSHIWLCAERVVLADEPGDQWISEYVVFGPDGTLVWRSRPDREPIRVGRVPAGSTVMVWVALEIAGRESFGDGAASPPPELLREI